jgi:hypothetical protein
MIASRFDPGGGDTFVARIMGGLRILRSGARLALAVFYTLGAWALDVAMVVLCLRAVHLDYIQPAGALLILVSLNLAISLPSTPGQLGAFEGGAVLGLHFLGAPPVESTAFALLYHAVQVIPVTILGLPGMRLAGKAEAEVGDLEKAGTLDGNPP